MEPNKIPRKNPLQGWNYFRLDRGLRSRSLVSGGDEQINAWSFRWIEASKLSSNSMLSHSPVFNRNLTLLNVLKPLTPFLLKLS